LSKSTYFYNLNKVNLDNKNEEIINEIVNDEVIDDYVIEENNYYIKMNYNGKTSEINLEDYVLGVVACEMPASFNIDALKAMAVAARTFALYKVTTNKNYVMKTTTSDQCYISIDKMKKNWGSYFDKNYLKIKQAVLETQNEYMTYKDEIIISFYFSISNGYTENCENVFSQKLDYLVSVDSKWDAKYQYKEKEKKISIKDFLISLGISDDNIKNIDIKKSDINRVDFVIVNGKKFNGVKFRQLLKLRSTDIEITHDNEYVYIKTKGYGHGVGMSQYGANVMASEGYNYDEILKYYYSGINIVNNL
jgi:stage II sporulation protein D